MARERPLYMVWPYQSQSLAHMAACPQAENTGRRHKMKHKYPATFPLLCIVFLHITFLACERRELTYYEVAEISLSADWSLSGLDSKEADFGATALFYPQTGGEPKVFLLGDRSGDRIRLPEGIYHVLLFNRSFNDFSNITFRGKECYETLEACAGKIITRPDEGMRTLVSSPEELAVATMEGFEVTEKMLGNYGSTPYKQTTVHPEITATGDDPCHIHLTPQKMTRKIIATFHIKGLNNVRSLTCRLDGVSESVFLATGKPSANTVIQEFVPSTYQFTPESPADGTISGTFEIFGLHTGSEHRIYIDALLTDGKTHFTESYDQVEVTETDNGQGTTTLRIEVNTGKIPDVEPENGSGSSFDVDVNGWENDINTDIPII